MSKLHEDVSKKHAKVSVQMETASQELMQLKAVQHQTSEELTMATNERRDLQEELDKLLREMDHRDMKLKANDE